MHYPPLFMNIILEKFNVGEYQFFVWQGLTHFGTCLHAAETTPPQYLKLLILCEVDLQCKRVVEWRSGL
jgi:hypothetical protein